MTLKIVGTAGYTVAAALLLATFFSQEALAQEEQEEENILLSPALNPALNPSFFDAPSAAGQSLVIWRYDDKTVKGVFCYISRIGDTRVNDPDFPPSISCSERGPVIFPSSAGQIVGLPWDHRPPIFQDVQLYRYADLVGRNLIYAVTTPENLISTSTVQLPSTPIASGSKGTTAYGPETEPR